MLDRGIGDSLDEMSEDSAQAAARAPVTGAAAGACADEPLAARVGELHATYRLHLESRRDAPAEDHGLARLRPLTRGVRLALANALRGTVRASRPGAGPLLRRQHTELPVPGLDPRLHGMSIAHLSDLYADCEASPLDAVRAALDEEAWDVCVCTGDFCWHRDDDAETRATTRLRKLFDGIGGPAYAVLGDRDSLRLLPALERLGLRMLVNESVAIDHAGARLYLGGVDDPHHYKTDDVRAALQTIPAGAPSVLLAHSPEVYARAEQAGFNILLSGHTLGGQFNMLGGPLLRDARAPRSLCRSGWRYRNLRGYTSCGCGEPANGARLECAPEVAFHTLLPA
jgi:predicted MPP superfamily phosphohydrolase